MNLSIIIEDVPNNEEAVVTTLEKTESVARSTTAPSFTPIDDGPPHVPMVRQTQADDEVHPLSDLEPDDPFAGCDSGKDFDSM